MEPFQLPYRFMLITLCVWYLLGVSKLYATPNIADESEDIRAAAADAHPKLVVFSFDGFRHDYVNAHDTPHLYALANDGVRGHMRSSFVTKTYPNHQSIVTGLYEPYHGIVNNQFIDPQRPGHRFDVDSPSTFWWDMFNRSVPIYIANQLYDPDTRFSGSIQWPGSIATYTDGGSPIGEQPPPSRDNITATRYRIHYLQDYEKMNWKRRIDRAIEWLTDRAKPANFVLLYFPEPDATAHKYGPFSAQIIEQIRDLDTYAVGYFRKRLTETRLSHRTNVIFLSDHGMAEIRNRPANVFTIEQCAERYPGLAFKAYGTSPVYSIVPISGPKKLSQFAETTAEIPDRNRSMATLVMRTLNDCARQYFDSKFIVYEQSTIPAEYRYTANRRILPLFLVAEEGYDVLRRTDWRPNGTVWGNHGYNNSLPSMRPLFVAQGPRFRSGYRNDNAIFNNVDLYPLMLHLLGIPLERFAHVHNGSFDRVRRLLTNQLYDGNDDYIRTHMQQTNSDAEDSWTLMLIYLVIGVAAIIICAACLVLCLGLCRNDSPMKRRRNMLFAVTGGDFRTERSLMAHLFRRFNRRRNSSSSSVGSNGGHLRNSFYENGTHRASYHKFSNEPIRHLDSSIDSDDDDDDECELYRLPPIQNGVPGTGSDSGGRKTRKKDSQNRQKNHPQDISDIDWDVIATGLDIDLRSKLDDENDHDDDAERLIRTKAKNYDCESDPLESNGKWIPIRPQNAQQEHLTLLLAKQQQQQQQPPRQQETKQLRKPESNQSLIRSDDDYDDQNDRREEDDGLQRSRLIDF